MTLSTIFSTDGVPTEIFDHPGMTSPGERAALYNLAKDVYRGEGVIADVGIFMGVSTLAFALGLKANPGALNRIIGERKPIQSYEIALWAKLFDRYAARPPLNKFIHSPMQEGENFFPLLKNLLSEHLDLIDFRIGDIFETARADAPIEIAFYDCLKNYERDKLAFDTFTPAFIPEKTIVIQQDYFYWRATSNKIRQEYFKDYFEFLGGTGGSAVFRFLKPVPKEYYKEDPVLGLSVDARRNLLMQAASRAPDPFSRACTELSLVSFALEENEGVIDALSWFEERNGDMLASKKRLREEFAKRQKKAGLLPAN